jgi:hypothetical protein
MVWYKSVVSLYKNMGFKVPRVMVMKGYIFCDITQCSPVKVNRHFRGTCRLDLQG